jgi:hypothetical protein
MSTSYSGENTLNLLYKELSLDAVSGKIVVYSGNYSKVINTFCGQNEEFSLMLK